jgi:hypothetical protein
MRHPPPKPDTTKEFILECGGSTPLWTTRLDASQRHKRIAAS